MRDLEVKTYDYTVKAIGLVKSIEKEYPEMSISDFKKSAKDVSLKFLEAMNAKENEDFANALRVCHSQLQKSLEILQSMKSFEIEQIENERLSLIKSTEPINKELETIIKKLIY